MIARKLVSFLHDLNVTILAIRYKTWLEFIAAELFLNDISAPIISWLEIGIVLTIGNRLSKWN